MCLYSADISKFKIGDKMKTVTPNFEINPFTLAADWVQIMDELRASCKQNADQIGQGRINDLLAARREIERVSQEAGLDKIVTEMIKNIRGL